MPDEKSIIKKGEQVYDDFVRLWKRRRLLCVGVVVAVLLPTALYVAEKFYGRAKLEAELAETKRDRDAKASQLAPFLATANQQFAAEPPNSRLNFLLDRIEILTKSIETRTQTGQTTLSREGQFRIRSKLEIAPKAKIQISTLANDLEGVELGKKIKETFEMSGFTEIEMTVNIHMDDVLPRGISVETRDALGGPLLNAILQLFVETGMIPKIRISEVLSRVKDGPDINIVIGKNY